jgi:hypothetical protein
MNQSELDDNDICCAYFNYQRQRIYVKTNKTIRKNKPLSTRHRNRRLKATRQVHVLAKECDHCHSPDVDVAVIPY